MADDITALFDRLERLLANKHGTAELTEIRDTLDDPLYVREIVRLVGTINDPSVAGYLIGKIRRLRREVEARCEKRKLHKELEVQMGVAGGIGIIGGSIIAAATATFPLIALVPVGGGAWLAYRGYFGAARRDEERHLLEQVAERMRHILEKVE